MKSKSKTSRVSDRYGMIEALEPRIAPAAVLTDALPASPTFRTVTAGGSLLLTAGDVLTTGSGGGGVYLLYVEAGKVLVHTTDLNHNNQLDFNEITGLSVGAGARIVSFVDIHGDVVTDLNADGSMTDGGKGDVLLDTNIASIDMRSLNTSDFVGTLAQTPAELVSAHLAMSSYSIFGNIYAGGGLGLANDSTSGLHIDTSGASLQTVKYSGGSGGDFYQATTPVIGSIYVGTSATGQNFSFGASGSPADIHGNLLAFNPSPGEAGASVYNIAAGTGEPFSIGTIHGGNGGFNGAGGSLTNVALQGDNAGVYKLIAGNAGSGTTGLNGGAIVNFSETGAVISEVVLQSGNGGTGLTGAGGNGGQITFNPTQAVAINAHFVLTYGSGGDGYTKGGVGGGSPSGKFTTPEGKLTTALDLVSTMRTIGSIGNTMPFDFNGDGYSDAVFSTTNPDQVVVALGNGSGSVYGLDSSHYIFLNSPAQVDSIVVGDFNGDGHPDIAVASGSGSFAGVEVYLSQYNPKTGAFMGFSDPLFSPLPSVGNGFLYSSVSITKIVAGDFTGSGVLGLAVLAQETTTTFAKDSILMFLNGETDTFHPNGTGYFYANFASGNTPYYDLVGISPNDSTIKATALKTFTPGNGHDVVIESDLASTTFSVIDDSAGTPVETTTVGYGYVDTNRIAATPTAANVSMTAFDALSFTITQDQNNKSIADIVALSQTPIGFLATFQGNGTGNFTLVSGTENSLAQVDQAGIYFIPNPPPAALPVAIVTVPNATNVYSSVAILDTGLSSITVLNINKALTTATALAVTWGIIPSSGIDSNSFAFDAFYPHPVASNSLVGSGPGKYGFITAGYPPPTVPDNFQGFTISEPVGIGFFNTAPFKTAGYYITAGNGGNSQSGSGGMGGSFGETLAVSGSGSSITATGSFSIVFPTDQTYQGAALITAGNGGNGFTNGGAGGDLTGISLTYASGTTVLTGGAGLVAGNGGESLTATGGAGGSLSHLYIISGDYFVAGDGGIGVVGGAGGSLYGNTQTDLNTGGTNNVNPDITLVAGAGATGLLSGGNGGNITYFQNEFNPIIGGVGGELLYVAGDAGNAVAGKAGKGGSIVNSSPSVLDNNLAGDIWLQGGLGGSGLFSGGGGNITGFYMVSTVKDIPTSFTVLAGFGGHATLLTGGAGGNVSDLSVSAGGTGVNVDVSYNRVVAGAGGSSAGGKGGAGGSITTINTASVAATAENVAAAGAGGDGLTAGGAGGNVSAATMTAGSTSGKVIVIAGDGGASYSDKPLNPKNVQEVAMAIGAVDGPGGNGGSITGFTQPVSTNTHVDLIAGNGGATTNHSVADQSATKDNSGKGGSITNVSVTGSIGNSSATVAIKSYNDILAGQTMQDFVDTYILGNMSAAIDDTVGNVGLVAGAAGRVEGGLPSSDGINGSVSNVHAENIMSMVAGNVEQVDLIQSLTDYGVTVSGGILGANKTVYFNPVTGGDQNTVGATTLTLGPLNYISPNGAYSNTPLPGGGILIDGAFLAKNIRTIQSPRDFVGTEA